MIYREKSTANHDRTNIHGSPPIQKKIPDHNCQRLNKSPVVCVDKLRSLSKYISTDNI